MRGARTGTNALLLGGFKWLPWGPPFAIRLSGWVEARRQYLSPVRLDYHRRATR